MKMKRVLSLLLALVMTMSLIVVPARAETSDGGVNETDSFYAKKTISGPDSNGNYTLTLEAYAKGEAVTTTTEKHIPAEIVLVLDVSGSMQDPLTGSPVLATDDNTSKLDTTKPEGYYSAVVGSIGQAYRSVRYNTSRHEWQYYNETLNSWRSIDNSIYSIKVYQSKMGQLMDAANAFIDTVATDAADNEVDHKISVVTYSGSAQTKSDSVSASAGAAALHNTINGLRADGATAADYGMEKAIDILKKADADSNKVVVFFTDGEPNHGSGFSSTVANDTVDKAYTLKNTYNAKVYSIGLFNNGDESTNVTKYMNNVSSNSQTAKTYDATGYNTSLNYYQKPSSGTDLSGIFQTIAEETTTGGAKVTMDSTTVLTDIVTDDFTIPNGVESVKVYTANCTGEIGDSLTFATKQQMTNANVNVSGNTLTVTNFDYSANWCGSHSGTYSGKKLIVELTIKPTQDAVTEVIVPTNTTNSAVSDENNTYEFKFVPPEVETANYTVNYYKTGTTTKLKDSKTVGRYFPGVNVTENAVDIPGYTAVGDTSKSLKIAASGNEINFYYAPVDYTITYDYNDGTTEDKTTGYTVEDTLTIEAAPTRDHYKFNGWKVTENVGSWVENTTYDGGESLTKQYGNVTLEAQWTELYGYALNFHKNLGTKTDFDAANMPDNQPETWEEVGTKTYTWTEVPTRTAYTFTGWSETADGTPLSGGADLKSYDITGKGADLVKKDLYAQWEANSYTITYDANGGTVTPASEDYTVEDKLIIPVPTREGYTFNGWKVKTVAEEGNWTVGEAVNTGEHASGMYGNVTLKADWIINRSTLQVDPNGGKWNNSTNTQSFTQDYNTTKTIANPTRTGYDFVGWTLSGDKNGSFSDKTYTFGPAKDTTDVLTAQWRQKTATINYVVKGPDDCGSVDPASETVNVVTGTATGSTATASSNNYKFVGWYSDPECKNQVSTEAKYVPTKADGDLWVDGTTYYAKFDWNVADLTITKKAAQGTTFDEGQSFVFHVTGNGVDMYVTVQGAGSVTIKDLLVGGYTVTEVTDWSWRYTPDEAEKDVTVEGGKTNTVEFINERTNNKWLSDDVTCVNTSDTTCDTFSAN